MRNNNYKDNRKWSDDVMPQVIEIFHNLTTAADGFEIKETSNEVDMTQAADLIISHPVLDDPTYVGSRVREEYALSNWPFEFTIRHAYTAGHKTEYTKVGDGHCDLNFYGFVVDGKIVRWLIIVFDEFRKQHEFVDGVLVPMPHLKYSLQKNVDGRNDFFAYDINSFENLNELVIAHSPGYFSDVEEKNLPGVPSFYQAKRKELRIDF